MYKRYIKRKGKVYGPYTYHSIRTKDGKVKNIYVIIPTVIGTTDNSIDKITSLPMCSTIVDDNLISIPVAPPTTSIARKWQN